MSLRITADGASLVVADDIEQRQCVLRMPAPGAATEVSGDSFYFPVDAAVSLDSPAITLGNYVATFVRDHSGTVLAQVDHVDEHEFGDGVYSVELDHAIKLYVQVRGSMRIETTGLTTTIETDGTLLVGARSRHNNPAGTITTTADPEDVMRAVSALSSSLKTTSVERSYPTLRGHPPELELGDELYIPTDLTPPETALRIEVPPRLRFVYPVASLAFYLGAEIVPGDTPRLCGEDGFSYPLDGLHGFEETVERVLEQTVLFDCVARTEGFYKLDLAERRAVDEVVDFDWATLYEQSLTEQLRAYLAVPYERIEAHVPEWKTTAFVAPTPENVELLPFFVDDLAHVRLPVGEHTTIEEVQTSSLLEFTRCDAERPAPADGPTRTTTRSSEDASGLGTGADPFVLPAETDSYEVIWAARGMPVGATKASIDGYRNGLDHSPSEEIGVTVVVNAPEMAEEGKVASDIYGDDAEFPLDLRVYENLSTEALRTVLETDRDFVHYVGHIDADGFDCSDGRLDARELDSVGVDAFFLNACASYEQGLALLEAGAVGGVVTISDVLNSGATRVGKTMVNLLNRGFPLRPALNLAREESFVGGQYAIVGDGDIDIVQRDGLGATLLRIEPDNDEFLLYSQVFPTREATMGTVTSSVAESSNLSYLSPGTIGPFRHSRDSAIGILKQINDPVKYAGELRRPEDVRL
jgi:hypothetical protein